MGTGGGDRDPQGDGGRGGRVVGQASGGGDQGQQGGAHAQYRVPGDAVGQVGGLAVAGKRQHADAVAGGELLDGLVEAGPGEQAVGSRGGQQEHQWGGWMVPAPPSTVTTWPSCRRAVASPVPTTAGMPYSRATREACAARVPLSVTTATARANSGVQAGVVAWATSTSPAWKASKSSWRRTMRTGPVARPGLAGCPMIAPSGTGPVVRTASTAASSSLASRRRCRSQVPRRRSTTSCRGARASSSARVRKNTPSAWSMTPSAWRVSPT